VFRAPALGLVFFFVGCTSLGDLSDYSSGSASSTEPEPATAGGSSTGGTGGSSGGPTDAGAGGSSSGEGARPTVIDQPDPPPMTSDPADAATAPPTPALARFVRLVADADVSDTPYTSVAELNVLDASGALLDRTGWVATADSAEADYVGGAPAPLAIDGDPSSMWHTPWSNPAVQPAHPHFLQVDLGAAKVVGGFRYLPRQDQNTNGSITDYRLFLSEDGVEWGEPVAEGRFSTAAVEHEVLLDR
jgi:F5/8 type C domain-containing protein